MISIVAAINAGLAIVAISLFAWLTDLPLVFPALGPSLFILSSAPFSPAAAPRSVIGGHILAMAAGCVMWRSMGVVAGGAAVLESGPWLVCTASITLALTSVLLVRLSCPHPPACASAMVIALGGITNMVDVLLMAAAMVYVTAQATAINRLACLPVPLWAPHTIDRAAANPRPDQHAPC